MKKPIRIFLADDHAVLRAGLKSLLNAEPDMEVVGEAGDGDTCVQTVAALTPDVILLDVNMPHCNGLEALPEIRRRTPASRILILTMHDDAEYLRKALSLGSAGYILKQSADTELLSAIRTVYNGGVFLHPGHTKILLEDTLRSPPQMHTDNPVGILSERELEVLRLIVLGHTNKEIAGMLFLSVKTVETYKARVMQKLDLRTRAALVRFALKHGLLDEDR